MDAVCRRALRGAASALQAELESRGFARYESEVIELLKKQCELEAEEQKWAQQVQEDPLGALDELQNAVCRPRKKRNGGSAAAKMYGEDMALVVRVLGVLVGLAEFDRVENMAGEKTRAVLVGFGAPHRSMVVEFDHGWLAKTARLVIEMRESDQTERVVEFETRWTCETHGFEECAFVSEAEMECKACAGKRHPYKFVVDAPSFLRRWLLTANGGAADDCDDNGEETVVDDSVAWFVAVATLAPCSELMRYKLYDMFACNSGESDGGDSNGAESEVEGGGDSEPSDGVEMEAS